MNDRASIERFSTTVLLAGGVLGINVNRWPGDKGTSLPGHLGGCTLILQQIDARHSVGAFFGSVQIKSADREQVVAAAGEVAQELGHRCYVGPVINGWVGVYPSENGQDHQVGEALAKRLETTVWHVLVHDDDVLGSWLWDAGRLADS